MPEQILAHQADDWDKWHSTAGPLMLLRAIHATRVTFGFLYVIITIFELATGPR